ncbi:unnamed protein product, partial [Ceratitis capitata]
KKNFCNIFTNQQRVGRGDDDDDDDDVDNNNNDDEVVTILCFGDNKTNLQQNATADGVAGKMV